MNPRERIRQACRGGGVVSLTGIMLPAYLARRRLAKGLDERRRIRNEWVKTYAQALLEIFRIELRVHGSVPAKGVNERGPRGRLVVANHRSAIDILALLSNFSGRMVARHDMAGWPLIGPAATAAETIFVDRKDSTSGMMAVRTMSSALKSGDTVNIFPEGTTFSGDELRPFHAGSFVATVGTECEIVPVGFAYPMDSPAEYTQRSFGVHVAGLSAMRGAAVGMSIGAPVLSGKRRARELERDLFAAVQEQVIHARKLIA